MEASSSSTSASSSCSSAKFVAKEPCPTDPSTRSNPLEFRASHLALDLEVDFEAKVLRGSVEVTATRLNDSHSVLKLDVNKLTIHGVHCVVSDRRISDHSITDESDIGSALAIPLQPGDFDSDNSVKVRVEYSTTPESMAVQWLAAEATKDKTAPFLFTQCQAIHARTLLPCQDTPMVKCTYAARIKCPPGTLAVMSALGNGNDPVETFPDGARTFEFNQPIAMAAYLIALAVGNLASKEVGPRSSVWAEPSVVDAAAYEFADTELFLTTGEDICGPYIWTRYDVLCMPPSFPYGGMENPCLTFVTPTLLAGDRSLADVVIHEITHSWTGNLVTNQTWEHFWLNEGWTMLVQRKISRNLYGQAVADLDAIEGLSDLKDSVEHFGCCHNFTALIPDLSPNGGLDPDDSFSTVPYEKGHALLCTIQHAVGGAAIFDPFIKAYVAKFGHPTMTLTSNDFKAFAVEYFATNHDLDLETKINWKEWFFKPGMPEGVAELFDDSLMAQTVALEKLWVSHAGGTATVEDVSGGRVTYEVNLSIAPDAADGYVAWLRTHMQEMLDLPGFLKADLARVADFKSDEPSETGYVGLVATYTVRDAAAMEEYLSQHAPNMRGNNPFVGKYRAWRRILHHAPRPSATDLEAFTCSQTTIWLKAMLEHHVGSLSVPLIEEMDQLYGLSQQKNSEIRFNWQRLCLAVGKVDIIPAVITFLKEQGRMKFVRPLYRRLLAASVAHPDDGAAFYNAAIETFAEAEQSYHPIASRMIRKDIDSHNNKYKTTA